MTSYFDPVILARAQFAFTVSFHFVFPAFSVGLASYLMVLEALWLTTGTGGVYVHGHVDGGDRRADLEVVADPALSINENRTPVRWKPGPACVGRP